MDDEVFKAILAMDSYNRGGGGLDLPGVGAEVGEATIRALATPQSGFFASSYIWDGKLVISYRGTDGTSFWDPDVWQGWVTGAGILADQAQLAQQFYSQEVGDPTGGPWTPANVILTGHSLGGGLAGLMATITGGEASFFDHMPFELAAAVYGATSPATVNSTIVTGEL